MPHHPGRAVAEGVNILDSLREWPQEPRGGRLGLHWMKLGQVSESESESGIKSKSKG